MRKLLQPLPKSINGKLRFLIQLILLIAIILLTLEVGVRFFGYKSAHFERQCLEWNSNPDGFFIRDSVLGWILGRGSFKIYKKQTADSFYVNHNLSGFRVTSADSFSDTLPIIQLYGCSWQYGFSLPDSEVCAYKLQSEYKKTCIQNYSVPGYSLFQCYLLMKRNFEYGKKPEIAVIHFADFYHFRNPKCRVWIESFKASLCNSKDIKMMDLEYPYFGRNREGRLLEKIKLSECPTDFPLRDKSALVNLLNTLYSQFEAKRSRVLLENDSEVTLNLIKELCENKGVKLIVASMDNEAKLFLSSEKFKEFDIIHYSPNASLKKFNSSPADPFHPNKLAHSIYAKELSEKIKISLPQSRSNLNK
jgi:hypothetical protein